MKAMPKVAKEARSLRAASFEGRTAREHTAAVVKMVIEPDGGTNERGE